LTAAWGSVEIPPLLPLPGMRVPSSIVSDIFVGHMDSGIECTLSKFADDTKLSGAVDMLEVRDAIQRDLDKLERWACENLMKFNKAKCKVLHMGWGNLKHKCTLGREQPWGEGLGSAG